MKKLDPKLQLVVVQMSDGTSLYHTNVGFYRFRDGNVEVLQPDHQGALTHLIGYPAGRVQRIAQIKQSDPGLRDWITEWLSDPNLADWVTKWPSEILSKLDL